MVQFYLNSAKAFGKSNMRTALLFAMVCLSLISAGNIYAQQQGAPVNNRADVDALFAEIQKANATRTIYGKRSRARIADVPFDTGFSFIERGDEWSIIRFNEPTVPGWVSSEFVKIIRGRARVNADLLNVRLRPSLQAKVLSTVDQDYESIVLGQREGFVKIHLPANYAVAIRNTGGSTDSAPGDAKKSVSDKQTGNASSVTPTTRNSGSQAVASSGWVRPQQSEREPATQPAANSRVTVENTTQSVSVASQAEREHLIAPGDAISLLVFGEEDLSIENVRVPESGSVSFPLIGAVDVADKTTAQVEQSVAALLSQGYVNNPRLSITIFSYRPIFIRGAVQNTGAFPYTEGLTVAKAIALAGGSTNSANRQGVSILRDGETVQEGLSVDSPVQIDSGDVITIEEEFGASAGDSLSYIYIHGEVTSPGEYLYRRGLTVEKAIVLASGFSLRASKGKITVTRYAGVGENEEPIKMRKVKLYMPVEPGDIIDVGASWF